ncbi:pentapeptide repeat-containing protein [Streptomyces sp. NPDC001868]|uniref:pentapeptide repeat-containing protein n=1 Tax=Streptomyces sp. NPDC001868 TaxID=3154401 RepID=UPI00331D4FAC
MLGVLLSSVIAVAGIWYSNNQVRDQLKISSQELGVAQEGQITDRYTKAVENLGDGAMDVRLGGIYALQRIMEDSPRDNLTVANVLATYVRTHASKPPKKGEDVPADVHAAVSVLSDRDPNPDAPFILDLQGTHLPRINLHGWNHTLTAKLTGVRLTNADLSGADLYNARLDAAELSGANLSRANLTSASLTNASLNRANLSRANLSRASLTNASLYRANLTGTNLSLANLREASLIDADLKGANLKRTNLQRADLKGANLKGTSLQRADLTGADLKGTNLRGTSLQYADLRGADLRGVQLNVQDLLRAYLDSDTKLPPDVARDPAVKARVAEARRHGG